MAVDVSITKTNDRYLGCSMSSTQTVSPGTISHFGNHVAAPHVGYYIANTTFRKRVVARHRCVSTVTPDSPPNGDAFQSTHSVDFMHAHKRVVSRIFVPRVVRINNSPRTNTGSGPTGSHWFFSLCIRRPVDFLTISQTRLMYDQSHSQ